MHSRLLDSLTYWLETSYIHLCSEVVPDDIDRTLEFTVTMLELAERKAWSVLEANVER